MLDRHVSHTLAIEPDEMAMLQSVLCQILKRRGISEESRAATRIAEDLISLFQHGVRDDRQLLAMLSGSKNFP